MKCYFFPHQIGKKLTRVILSNMREVVEGQTSLDHPLFLKGSLAV